MSAACDHPAALAENELLKHCTLRRGRRSGPGGQHRNKVETAVVITHEPSGIQGEAGERRSQAENRRAALFRLRVNLALHIRGDASPTRTPSGLWQSRVSGGKISVNPRHGDFPALLAEALDCIGAHAWDVKAAAEQLGCSTSQLVRFLQGEPRALAQVNRMRRERGLGALK